MGSGWIWLRKLMPGNFHRSSRVTQLKRGLRGARNSTRTQNFCKQQVSPIHERSLRTCGVFFARNHPVVHGCGCLYRQSMTESLVSGLIGNTSNCKTPLVLDREFSCQEMTSMFLITPRGSMGFSRNASAGACVLGNRRLLLNY